jgi:hypothetical protein
LPTTTMGWRARRERRSGWAMRSGSSAARALRGAIRDAPEFSVFSAGSDIPLNGAVPL